MSPLLPTARDPDAPLLPVEHPLLLLPLRIETRFDGNTLLIRAYPDDIHLDRRAESADAHPTARPRLLPDRLLATGWRGGTRVFAAEGAPIDEESLRVAPDLSAESPDEGMRWLFDFEVAERAGMALRIALDHAVLDRLLVFGVRDSLAPTAGAKQLTDLLAAHAETDGVAFVPHGEPTNRVGRAAPLPAASATASEAASNGRRLATALGLAPTALRRVADADRDEESVGRAMNTALWPATLGYFLAHRFAGAEGPELTTEDLQRGRRHFIDHVRSGGPLATLRVGDQPYGFLPATTIDAFVPQAEELGGLVDVLRRARTAWLRAAAGLPRSHGGGAQLLEVLRNQPTAQRFLARTLMGRHYAANLHRYLRLEEWATWSARQEELGVAALRELGLAWRPRQAHAVFAPDALPLGAPVVADTSIAFLEWLRDADLAALRGDASSRVPAGPPPVALLDVVLRHAALRAFADAGAHVLGDVSPEPELHGFEGTRPIWERFEEPLRGVTRRRALGAWLATASTPETAGLKEFRQALAILADLPAEVLARHFTGSLDLASYRLDAWLTSVATRRLAALRDQRPRGLRVGAYGWVENLAPRPEASVSEGWIGAPSLAHATTAALLRNGYRARRLGGQNAGALAIDLTSRRVRTAEWILDGVRRGRSLAALLGARLERSLHDAQLDVHVPQLREYTPAMEGAVVDGLELARRWRDERDLPSFDFAGDRAALEPHLDLIVDALDAIGDLALAEGVHQLASGNHVRAGALFDALGRGEQPPPEFSVARTPRSAIHHPVCVLLALRATEPRPAAGRWPTARDSVRAAAEPRLDSWAARVLGSAKSARFSVAWREGADEVVGRADVSLFDTGLTPLDVVYLAGVAGALDEWVLWAAERPADVPVDARATVETSPAATVELARTLRRLLAGSRPAVPADLDPDTTPPANDDGALARARAAADALTDAVARLETAANGTARAPLERALVRLARFGVPGCLPAAQEPMDGLRTRANAVLSVARARSAEATAAVDAGAIVRAVLGEAFALTSDVQVPERARTAASARGRPDPDLVTEWLDLVGRVRPGAEALSDLLLYSDALGLAGRFAAAQLPHNPGEPLLPAAAAELPGPRSLALAYLPTSAPLSSPVAALVVDEWVEAVPRGQETAGIAFHYERPAAQPPHACLIAVPPDLAAPWTLATLEAVLRETLEAAAMRAVPPEALGEVAQFLPATLFAFNPAGETVSTDFTALAVQ